MEGEQRFKLADSDTIQMNYRTVVVLESFIVAGVAVSGLLSKYIVEHGEVGTKGVLVWFETCILNLSNKHNKSLRSILQSMRRGHT